MGDLVEPLKRRVGVQASHSIMLLGLTIPTISCAAQVVYSEMQGGREGKSGLRRWNEIVGVPSLAFHLHLLLAGHPNPNPESRGDWESEAKYREK